MIEEMMNTRHELMRQLIDLAVNEGRRRYSQQTGYVHYCYGLVDDEPHLPMPLLDNFLYALALLRTRTVEHINEAKRILSGILHFQNVAENGLFPIYIHDFPACKDRFLGTQIGIVIYEIIKTFHLVLGADLNKRLEQALKPLVTHSLKTHGEKPAPYHLAIKIAALAICAGKWFTDSVCEAEGQQLLNELQKSDDRSSWYCPSTLGSILLALSMVYPQLKDSPWSDFWRHINDTWHRQTGSYIGPAIREWQQGSEPQVNLYDLWMSYLQGALSKRVIMQNTCHLEAILILPREEVLELLSYPLHRSGMIGQAQWKLFHDQKISYSSIEADKLPANPAMERGLSLIRFIWGNLSGVHSFVCQHPQGKHVECTAKEMSLELVFFLEGPVEVEDQEKSCEVSFYLDACEGMTFLVEGTKASTFLLSDCVVLSSGGQQFELTFSIKNGEGHFQGHRRLGNRPSQIANRGAKRFEAYDWELALRTVRRSPSCALRVKIVLST